MSITWMDRTLRDGANVVGNGFSAETTDLVPNGLTACHVPNVESGNAGGIPPYRRRYNGLRQHAGAGQKAVR